jgi:predicted small lipoprotein YifL
MVGGGSGGALRARVRVIARAARRSRVPVAAILAGSLLAACGQRGPLYLPKPPPEPAPRVRTPSSGTVVLPPARSPAEAAPGASGTSGTSTAPADTERPARRTD